MHIDHIETPAAIIDLDLLESHIKRFQAYLDQHGIANRPHIKTHKIPAIAKMQIAAGAVGITCQKLGEAEVMAEAGIDDILISYNLIGEEKMARLGALQAKANMVRIISVATKKIVPINAHILASVICASTISKSRLKIAS